MTKHVGLHLSSYVVSSSNLVPISSRGQHSQRAEVFRASPRAKFQATTGTSLIDLVEKSALVMTNHRKTTGKPEENGGLMGSNGVSPSGNDSHSYWKMTIWSGFSHEKTCDFPLARGYVKMGIQPQK